MDPKDSVVLLLHRASQRANATFAQSQIGSSITSTQMFTLFAVDLLGSASQIRLAEETGVDRSTMSDVVRRLEKAGLLKRKRSKQDLRSFEVELTEAGRAMVKKATAISSDVGQMLLSRIPAARRQSFLDSLRTLAGSPSIIE
jgi:DNA-binding MarR family transcriptional regulator